VVDGLKLEGRLVRLEPLTLEHLPGLCEVGLDAELWRWTLSVVRSREDMRRYVEAALAEQAAGTALPFVIVDRTSGRVIGSTRYGNIAMRHRRLEIGWTWLTPERWGTGINVEAKLLLLAHAFDRLGAMRVEFKTDARNERSRAAIVALGARFEGIFRKHMRMPDGRIRDSAWYAIVDDEWPAVRSRLEARLEALR